MSTERRYEGAPASPTARARWFAYVLRRRDAVIALALLWGVAGARHLRRPAARPLPRPHAADGAGAHPEPGRDGRRARDLGGAAGRAGARRRRGRAARDDDAAGRRRAGGGRLRERGRPLAHAAARRRAPRRRRRRASRGHLAAAADQRRGAVDGDPGAGAAGADDRSDAAQGPRGARPGAAAAVGARGGARRAPRRRGAPARDRRLARAHAPRRGVARPGDRGPRGQRARRFGAACSRSATSSGTSRSRTLAATPEALRRVPVHTAHGLVALGDLAEVRKAPGLRMGLARYQGLEVVSMRVVKQPTAETLSTARRVRGRCPGCDARCRPA